MDGSCLYGEILAKCNETPRRAMPTPERISSSLLNILSLAMKIDTDPMSKRPF